MNFIRSYNAIGTPICQWYRQVGQMVGRSRALAELGGQRWMCSKPQTGNPEPPPAAPAVPAHAPRPAFKLPGYRPSPMDQRILVWSGRFKTPDQIPELVSFEMLDAARNKVRVKACYGMMIATIAACLFTVILGKRAAGRHESLTSQNMEKKARWRQEAKMEKEEAALAEKTP
ncbi:protein FAM162B [Coregonus clupeaformis]|uniref:Protein FAM162B n=1 Tax=Coregonus suidteri TaxID=861788 RepID=A0AAN8KVF2_9TELE|nr:protein FAM162B [Coregonus clupeaformis]